MKIPLAICLFATTRGHHSIKTRWLETVKDLNKQIPLINFSGLFANIKITSEEESAQGREMDEILVRAGFKTNNIIGYWKHMEGNSHQEQYLNDIFSTYSNPEVLENQYVLHLEEDWLIRADNDNLLDYISRAIKILEKESDVLQVRFPRFSNEAQRIENVRAKHGIDTSVELNTNGSFYHNDFSLNPSIFRSRDLRAASLLMKKNRNSFAPHVEHGFGTALKYFSYSKYSCFYCFNPNEIRSYHIGAPLGEEDKVGVELKSN